MVGQPRSGFRALTLGWRATCLAALSIVASCPATAQELKAPPPVYREHITVLLKDGTTFQAHAFQKRFELAVVAFAEGSTRRYVNISDIEAILDTTAANVAPRILRMRYRPVGLENAAMGDFVQARSVSFSSGRELRDVRLVMNPNRRELLVLDGKSPCAVPWDDIEQIETPDGRRQSVDELTSGIQRAGPRRPAASASMPGPGSSSNGNDPAPLLSPRSLLPWRFALELLGGFDGAGGDYYVGTTGGPGFGVRLHAALSDEAALLFDVQRLGLGIDESFGLVSLDQNVTILSQRFQMDALKIGVGAEYHALLDHWSPRGGFWFAQTSLCVVRHAAEAEVTIQSENGISTGEGRATEAGLALTAGAGVIRTIHSILGLSVSGDVGLLFKNPMGILGGVRVGVAFID